ncbi:hypothetical protein Ndes2437B_g08523 [Nannochloris sp. 'desiccata']
MDDRRNDMGSSWLLRNLKKEKPEKVDREDDDEDKIKHGDSEKTEETSQSEKNTQAAEPAKPAKPPRAPIEANHKLRVLAYSDSDEDLNEHVVQRVKEHLLPHNEEEEAKSAEAIAAEEAAAEEERLAQIKASDSGRTLNRLAAAVSGIISQCARQLTPSIVLKTVAMMALRNINSSAGNAVEASALVFGAAGALVDRRARYRGNELSTRVACAQFHAVDLGKAAALAVFIRVAQQTREHAVSATARPRRFVARLVSGVDISALERSMSIPDPDKPPETAAEWAAVFSVEMSEMRRMLTECGIGLAPPRWDETNAELMRFAEACGLKEAETPGDRGAAIEKAVRRVIATVEWTLDQKEKVDEAKLRRWERLVAWRGSDATGHPMLLIRFGRALQLCAKHGRLEAFADAIAAQVAAGVASRLSNYPGGAERIVAVLDCRETSNWEALTRSRHIVSLIKKLNTELSAHYPGRLQRVHVLELPLLARMALQSVLTPLVSATREKIVPASIDDDSLPVTVALLQKRRSYARGLGRTMSDHSLATTEDGADTPREDEIEENEEERVVEGEGDGSENGHLQDLEAPALAVVDAEADADGGGSSAYTSPRAELTETDFGSSGRETSSSNEIEVPQAAAMSDNYYSVIEAAGGGVEAQKRSVNAPPPAIGDSADSTNVVMVIPEGQVPTDSPATDVATNLLEALDEAADSATEKNGNGHNSNNQEATSSIHSGSTNNKANVSCIPVELPPPETGSAGLAPTSHYLISAGTPSTLSPQSSQGANSIQDHLDSPSIPPAQQQQQLQKHPGPAGSTPGGAAAWLPANTVGPLAGASAMLRSMLPSVAANRNRLGLPPTTKAATATGGTGTATALSRTSPTIATSLRSPRLRPYRLGNLSSENSLGSLAETPSATTAAVPSARKGGLTTLPPRPSSTRKTPAKSSLRRPETVKKAGTGRLFSFPLRRQSSVSWSEVLTTVKEIYSTPSRGAEAGTGASAASTSAAGSGCSSSSPVSSSSGNVAATPPDNGVVSAVAFQQQLPSASPSPAPPMSPEARIAIEQPAFPGLIVLIMVFGILQRLLLSI